MQRVDQNEDGVPEEKVRRADTVFEDGAQDEHGVGQTHQGPGGQEAGVERVRNEEGGRVEQTGRVQESVLRRSPFIALVTIGTSWRIGGGIARLARDDRRILLPSGHPPTVLQKNIHTIQTFVVGTANLLF